MFARWADAAAEVAVGALAMSIDEFEAMTPREFEWRFEARRQEERRALLRTAQLACWVMNPWLKKPIGVGDLVALQPDERTQTDWQAWATAE